jgi:hypothetical protein
LVCFGVGKEPPPISLDHDRKPRGALFFHPALAPGAQPPLVSGGPAAFSEIIPSSTTSPRRPGVCLPFALQPPASCLQGNRAFHDTVRAPRRGKSSTALTDSQKPLSIPTYSPRLALGASEHHR